jgi:UDP:flavonoid glycosyltransferase YjiC (YdhE family)
MVLPLAERCRALGHDVVVAAPEETARRRIVEAGFRAVPTPRLPAGAATKAPRVWQTQASLLEDFGFASEANVARYLRDWSEVLKCEKVDAVIANAAPGPQLAAQAAGILCLTAGIGIELPPKTTPLPELRYWVNAPREAALDIEARLADTFSAAFGRRLALRSLQEWLSPAAELFLTMPELDPYGPRAVSYLGHTELAESAVAPDPAPGVIAYLRRTHIDLGPLMEALSELRQRVLLIVPDADATLRARAQTLEMTLSTAPVALDAPLRHCRILITHGGHNLACRAILRGIPHLILPATLEQFVAGRRLADQRLAVMADPKSREATVHALRFALGSPALHQALKEARERYVGQDATRTVRLDHALSEMLC